MGPTEWTIIGVGVALFVGLGSLIRFSNASTKNELKGDIANLRTELKGDIAEAKAESKADFASLRLDVQANRAEIITNRRMLGRFSLHRYGEDGLPLAPLTDSLEPPEGTGSEGEGDND